MRGRLVWGGILILGVALLFFWFGSREREIKNLPPKNKTVVFFGDSLVEGVGSTPGNDLASILERRTGLSVVNAGVAGDTTTSALPRLDEALEYDPGVAIILLGGNDFLKKIPNETTFRNLGSIVSAFQDRGAVVMLLGVRSGIFGDGRGEEYESLAEKYGTVYLSDVLKETFADTRYMSDAVHPNDAGYARIADRIEPELRKLYR